MTRPVLHVGNRVSVLLTEGDQEQPHETLVTYIDPSTGETYGLTTMFGVSYICRFFWVPQYKAFAGSLGGGWVGPVDELRNALAGIPAGVKIYTTENPKNS